MRLSGATKTRVDRPSVPVGSERGELPPGAVAGIEEATFIEELKRSSVICSPRRLSVGTIGSSLSISLIVAETEPREIFELTCETPLRE